jgi:hypothetical protein
VGAAAIEKEHAMGYSMSYHERSEAAHRVTRRCRRCRQNYPASDQDPNDLCLRCAHNKDFEQRVAEWFLRNPFASFEVFALFDERRVRVILNSGKDWVEFDEQHPVFTEAIRRQQSQAAS